MFLVVVRYGLGVTPVGLPHPLLQMTKDNPVLWVQGSTWT
jgi:hypothetical protein